MEPVHPAKRHDTGAGGKQASVAVTGTVAFFPGDTKRDGRSHDCMSHTVLAERLARVLGYRFAGTYNPSCRYDNPLYIVPSETLVTKDAALQLGIRSEQELFGGVVPFPFVATKTITHPLISADAVAPHGWSPAFASRVREAVLPGYAAFSLQDAERAGRELLSHGAIRLKQACGIGGLGQSVAGNETELEEQLNALDVEEVLHDGLVLEENLAQVQTQSVGQVRVGGVTATYYGHQRLTRDNSGAEVYGGSDLIVARGGFDALLRLDLDEPVRLAIAQARVYHEAAMSSFPGMFASRCNYDIAQGLDNAGRWRSGVLEQSWRIGGASGAEIEALEAFQADAACDVVRASTTEVYGTEPAVPADARVYFSGDDPCVGPLTKYSRLHAYP